jgi:alpha,alpha-trehalase
MHTDRTISDGFAEHTTPVPGDEDVRHFDRTRLAVKLFEKKGSFVSRSDARRLLEPASRCGGYAREHGASCRQVHGLARSAARGRRSSLPAEAKTSPSLFPAIADYGFLSNCEQSCLVSPDGSIEWLCLPRPDSPSVFGALLDRAAGLFRFGPGSTHVPQHRRYMPGTLTAGQSAYVALSWGGAGIPASQDEAFSALNTTVDFWRDWLSAAKIPDHPWKPYIDRSALTLKGLSYAPTGAIMAAATTSLPETPGGARNWDCRFTWIRDSAFILRSLYRLGFGWEAIEYWGFVIDAVSGGDLNHKFDLQIMYGISGERDLTERTPDHLSGYRGARPVRVGNGAWNQHQHDVWGMILDALDVQFRHGAAEIVEPVWEGLAGFVDAALAHWRAPDQGIWEVRGEPKHFTASKMMCWVAASRGADLARERGADERAQRWQAGADEIMAEILDKGVSSRGVFRQHYETDDLDASLLLLPIMGFLPVDDERIKSTVLAIADELTKDGLVLRYRVEGTDAEEIDTATGQHLGNFPQAFTHLALIEAVSLLIEAEQESDFPSVG